MSARVRDVMTTRVVAVRKDATFKDIVALLIEHRVSAFPVLDEGGKVIGVVTEADLMSKPPVIVTPDEPVTSAARLMYHGRVKRLPVVGVKGELVGIVSRTDVLSVYSRPDEEIRREITENVIGNEFLADPGRFAVTVSR